MPDLLDAPDVGFADRSWEEVAPQFQQAFPGVDPSYMRQRYQQVRQAREAQDQQEQAQQLLQTHAASDQPQSWETLAPNFHRRFPLANQEALQQAYVPLQQQAGLQRARARLPAMYDEPLSDTLLRWLPGGTTALNTQDAIELQNATQRFNAGQAQPADFDVLARRQAQEETDKKLGTAGELTRFFSRLPGFAGELALGGLATAPLRAGATRLLGGGAAAGIVGAAASTAAATPLIPSLYTDRWIQNNIEHRRDPLDVRGLPAALALAGIQNAMFGAAGAIGQAVGPAGNTLQAAAGRVGVGVGLGAIGQQAADAVTSSIDRAAQSVLGTSLGLDTKFGRIGQLLDGQAGEAMRDAVKDAVMMAGFGVLHELGRQPTVPAPRLQPQAGATPPAGPSPGPAPTPAPQPQPTPTPGPRPSAGPTPSGPTPTPAQAHPVILAMIDALNYLKGRNAHLGFGRAAENAGRAVKAVSDEFLRAVQGNPDITRADLRRMFDGMRDNPLRDYAYALADHFPEQGRAPSGQQRAQHPEYPPQPPPDVQEAQVVTPEGISGPVPRRTPVQESPGRPLAASETAPQAQTSQLGSPYSQRGQDGKLKPWTVVEYTKHAGEAAHSFYATEEEAARARFQLQQEHEGTGVYFDIKETPGGLAKTRPAVEGEVLRWTPEAQAAALPAPEGRQIGPPRPVAFEKKDRFAALQDLWKQHEAGQQVTSDDFFKAANLDPRQEYILRQHLEGKSFGEIAADPRSGVNTRARAEQIEQDARDLLGVRPGNSIDKLLGLQRAALRAPGAVVAEIGSVRSGGTKQGPRNVNERVNDLFLAFEDAHREPTGPKIDHVARELVALDNLAKKRGMDLAAMLAKKSRELLPFVARVRELIKEARASHGESEVSPVVPRTEGVAAAPAVPANAQRGVQTGPSELRPAPPTGPNREGAAQVAPAVSTAVPDRLIPPKVMAAVQQAKEAGDWWQVAKMFEVMAPHFDHATLTAFKDALGIPGTIPRGKAPRREASHYAQHQAQWFKDQVEAMIQRELENERRLGLSPAEEEAFQSGFESGQIAETKANQVGQKQGNAPQEIAQAQEPSAAEAESGLAGEPNAAALFPGDFDFDPGQFESGAPGRAGSAAGTGQPRLGGITDLAKKFLADEGGQVNLGEMADELRRYLAPASRGPEAKEAAGIMRENLAILARKTEIAANTLAAAKRFFNAIIARAKTPYQKTADFLAFMDEMEAGTIHNLPPEMRQVAQTMRDMFDERERQLDQRGLLKTFIDNYFGHIWKDPTGSLQGAQIGPAMAARRPLPGRESYKKQRTIPTYRDGILAGFEPVSYNPVELALLKLREIDKSIMGRDVFEEAQRNGLTQFVRIGDKGPPGWVPLEDKLGKVFAPSTMGLVQTGNYWMPEQAATLLHNYLSPGLVGRSQTYDLVRGFSNLLNQFQLGFSAFHLGFVTMDTQVSAMALAVQQISRGQLGEALKSFGKGIVPMWAPIEAYFKGSKVLREYYKPNSQGALMMAMVDSLMKGGGRATMDKFYGGTEVEKFREALTNVMAGNYGHIGGLLGRALPAFSEMISKPVMEHIVPRMKLGVFFDMAEYEMNKLGPNASQSDQRAALGRAWDSVENRLGQLTYDNLFWRRTFKDVLMVGVRSVGWNVGTWRELGGGIKDIPSSARGTLKGEGISPRLAYIIGLPMVTAMFGAIAHYLMTGKAPEEAKDYIFPKNGKTRKDGSADRISMPSYMRDVAAVLNRANEGPLRIVRNLYTVAKHKVNPGLSTVLEMLENENFYGSAIYDPSDTQTKQALALVGHLFGSFEPFVSRNIRQGQQQGTGDTASAIRGFFGMTAAPSNIVHTWDEQRAREAARRIQLAPLERLRRGR